MPYNPSKLKELLDTVTVNLPTTSLAPQDPVFLQHARLCAKLDAVQQSLSRRPNDNRILNAYSYPGKLILSSVLAEITGCCSQLTDFDVLGRIGEGQYGLVDAVRWCNSTQVYAMKTIPKAVAIRHHQLLALSVERSLHLKAALPSNYRWAPPLMAAFRSPESLHLVLEYAPCGTLWDRISNIQAGSRQLPAENEIVWWASQIVAAVTWVHQAGFAHRDIKPHNFLLFPDSRLKITDFGSAAPLVRSSTLIDSQYCLIPVGTPDYIAPEILIHAEHLLRGSLTPEAEAYNCSVDWWSVGVTLYETAFGQPPFWATSIRDTYNRIVEFKPPLSIPDSERSDSLQNLLIRLVDPSEHRLGYANWNEIRRHPFFNGTDFLAIDYALAPEGLEHPHRFDYMTDADSFSHGAIGFSAFLEQSLDPSSIIAPDDSIQGQGTSSIEKVDWSWEPLMTATQHKPSAESVLPATPRPQSRHSLTTPRLTSRTPAQKRRNISERHALREMIRCIGLSARKPARRSSRPSSSTVTHADPDPQLRVATVADLEKWHSQARTRLDDLRSQLTSMQSNQAS